MAKWWSLLFAVVMILCFGMFLVAPFWGMWLPEGVSTHAAAVDRLFYVILAVTGFFFVLTEAILCYFMFKFGSGRDKGEAPAQVQPGYVAKLFKPVTDLVTNLLYNQHRVEMAWTLVPALILLYIAFAQVSTWADVKYQSRMPTYEGKQTPLQVEVSARQFEWRMRYPSSERLKQWLKNKSAPETFQDYKSFATVPQMDDVQVVNELHVWKDNPVLVHLSTRDVLHSFNIPHMRVKQDALPGKMIPVWFTPTRSNTGLIKRKEFGGQEMYIDGVNPDTGKQDRLHIWDLACAELCGWGHYRMVGRLYVHKDEQEFLDWLEKAEGRSRSTVSEKVVARP